MSKLFVLKCEEPVALHPCGLCADEHRYGEYLTINHGLYVTCFENPDDYIINPLCREITKSEAMNIAENGKYNGVQVECIDHFFFSDCDGRELRRMTVPTEARM